MGWHSAPDTAIWTKNAGPPIGSVPVSVIVLTLNEAVNIQRCISSVGWADQVLVVDSGSDDGTQDLASSNGAEVLHHPFEDYGTQREWALKHPEIRNDWVLFVDADEWISAALAAEIADSVIWPVHDGYAFRVQLVWQSHHIRHAGWGNTWVTRLARRRSAQVSGSFAEKLIVSGSVGRFKHPIVDEDLKPFSRWIEKHNRYSTLKAQVLVDLRRRPIRQRLRDALNAQPRVRITRELLKQLIVPHLPVRPFWLFLYMYVFRVGFLDGRYGFLFCTLQASQQAAIDIKVDELERCNQEAVA